MNPIYAHTPSTTGKSWQHMFYVLFALTAAIELVSSLMMQPIFDDLFYYTAPYQRDALTYLLPYGSWWRPVDALVGLLLQHHVSWFPTFNHFVVWLMHVLSAIVFYRLLLRFAIHGAAAWVGTLYYLVAPSMLGTLFDTDSINQTGSMLFCLLGLLAYTKTNGISCTTLWLSFTFVATLFKESGITWFVITPLLGSIWADSKHHTRRMLLVGIASAFVYMTLRLMLPHGGAMNGEYHSYLISNTGKTLGKLATTVFLPIDNVSLLHDSGHALVWLSALLTLPLLLVLAWISRNKLLSMRLAVTVTCLFIALSPNILTMLSVMHAYGAQPFTALLLAWLLPSLTSMRQRSVLLALFFTGIMIVDAHHGIEKYKSGLCMEKLGRQSAELIKRQTQFRHATPDSIYSISIASSYRKYNTFCQRDAGAFCWGYATRYAVGYAWPKTWADTCIQWSDAHNATVAHLAQKAYAQGFRLVLKVDSEGVSVVPSH